MYACLKVGVWLQQLSHPPQLALTDNANREDKAFKITLEGDSAPFCFFIAAASACFIPIELNAS